MLSLHLNYIHSEIQYKYRSFTAMFVPDQDKNNYRYLNNNESIFFLSLIILNS